VTSRPAEPRTRFDPAPDPYTENIDAAPRMDRRRYERMVRGKLVPDARLDLHGMTRADAHRTLIAFILAAQANGHRLVLVITGKGRPDPGDSVIPERQGILRHSLPHWLAAPPLTGRVIEWRPAHARHGGTGAVYLYLRRRP
jgi:DNA-nicking Smr family endonuclease